MKKTAVLVIFVFGLVIGLLAAALMLNLSAEGIMLKEIISPYDFEKTVKVLSDRINNAENWHVTGVIDQSAEVEGHGGKNIGKLKIIQYCSGKYAYEMLSADERKKMSVMMPKSFAVYEKSGGRVYIALMNGAFMGKMFKGPAFQIIEDVSLEVERIMSFTNFKYSLF
ncbi:MAG: DUF302 domain-containing protein [Candidatus Goldbacteria bacterium]|nr:DUF302 domain-containing protein [Candidatus Goldiibacteriota bacterium]